MTEPEVPEPPFDPGTVLLNPIEDKRYEVVGVERHYEVVITEEDPGPGETVHDRARYPEESMAHMIEAGRLASHPDQHHDSQTTQPTGGDHDDGAGPGQEGSG